MVVGWLVVEDAAAEELVGARILMIRLAIPEASMLELLELVDVTPTAVQRLSEPRVGGGAFWSAGLHVDAAEKLSGHTAVVVSEVVVVPIEAAVAQVTVSE